MIIENCGLKCPFKHQLTEICELNFERIQHCKGMPFYDINNDNKIDKILSKDDQIIKISSDIEFKLCPYIFTCINSKNCPDKIQVKFNKVWQQKLFDKLLLTIREGVKL